MPKLKLLLTLMAIAWLTACSSTSTLRLCTDRLQAINAPAAANSELEPKGRAAP